MKNKLCLLCLLMFGCLSLAAEDGYQLWLRYKKIDHSILRNKYRSDIAGIFTIGSSPTLRVAQDELRIALEQMLDQKVPVEKSIAANNIVSGTSKSSTLVKHILQNSTPAIGPEGYVIKTTIVQGKKVILIAAHTDIGILYGTFAFLRLLQTHQDITSVSIVSDPKVQRRILNHWDNLNRSVERGYAGISIWNWHTLPGYIDQRYIDYARANASIGINGTVLTNVNANSMVLTKPYLIKTKALADVLRPYGIKVYLTAKFSAPIDIGGLKTADPENTDVRQWWKDKCAEIYQLIPDFGGFLVKANSEGQPGPQGYGRTHADGANMFADALAPHGGIVMWRAFVYDVRVQKETEHFREGGQGETGSSIAAADRFKQAYTEFKPLDGKFRNNVLIQVKNGPIDFQPREPFSPLFGAMPKTPLMMEFQITQEYTGQGTHLFYESPLFKECLNADTYIKGTGSTVAKVIDGTLDGHAISGIAGVANIGNSRNWTGHVFAQANWYCFGRLAWDYNLSSEQIADEWLGQTFTNNKAFLTPARKIMMASREALVNYMTPLGLNHIMGTGHHYGPAPWVANAGRADWNPVYYHKADATGLGFDRTSTGSDALAQYTPAVQAQWSEMKSCDEKFLLWFHHVPWTFKMKSGRSLWEQLCHQYNAGVDSVRWMQSTWNDLSAYIDKERFQHVNMLLGIQYKEAAWWRNACLLYFQTFSQMPIPSALEQPDQSLDYYKSLKFPYAPGIGGNL